MKVIFLDVDGVLNTTALMKERAYGTGRDRSSEIGEEHVAQLQRIVDATGAHVVISSSWRHGMTFKEIGHLLESKGFRGLVIGQTPDYVTSPDRESEYGCRGDEIRTWLNRAWVDSTRLCPIDSFVVLDDDSDMRGVEHRHVRTTMDEGLTAELADKAIAMLNEPTGWGVHCKGKPVP